MLNMIDDNRNYAKTVNVPKEKAELGWNSIAYFQFRFCSFCGSDGHCDHVEFLPW